MQYPATKKNWTMVRVTGYGKRLRITFPVLEETAEEVYHRPQRTTKRIVDIEGQAKVSNENGRGVGDRRRGDKGAPTSLSE
jgi:hypothetical protein